MKSKRKPLILLALSLLCLTIPVHSGSGRPERARKAMVVTVHYLASEVGAEILRDGGNAVDAAVATSFALAVVHPEAGNIGGGGFMLIRWADGKTDFLDYREKAPKAATEKMYVKPDGKVDTEASLYGYRAIAVPGSVAGLAYAQKKWGKLPLKRVMAPAIRLAKKGWVLSSSEARGLRDEHLAKFPESRRIFQRGGRYYEPGDVFRQPELARTLERIAKNPDEFYRGKMAQQIAAAVQRGGGLMTVGDLAAYEVKERTPLRGTYRGYDIVSAPPPSSGGIALIETLNILEGYDLAALGNRSADSIHLITEAMRRTFYDRSTFLGDPDFANIPVAQLIDKKYAAAWRASVDPRHASLSATLERPKEFSDLDRVATARPVAVREPEHTTHFSIVDENGNAVAVTTTINDSWGSRVTVEGLGFLLNNEMDDFTAAPGVPNAYGLIQGPANAIGPGKRPLSAMTPTIITKDGKLALIAGSPGGPRIISTVINIVVGTLDLGMNVQDAVNAPRFHHQWLPDHIVMERVGFSPDTLRLLEARGHNLELRGMWSDGECIAVDPKTGELLGASDYRNSTGKAVGY